jgi:hypothetical protein
VSTDLGAKPAITSEGGVHRPRASATAGPSAERECLRAVSRDHRRRARAWQDWGIFLGDVPAATAILDRFLAHATIVQVTGKSYRLRQRASTTDD